MSKEKIKIILKFVILFGLHYFWLRMYIFFNAITQGLGGVSSGMKDVAKYYLTSWWTIPATAIVVNLINVLFAKLIPIESKRISIIYWSTSVIITTLLLLPYIIYMWAVFVIGP